MRAEAAKGVQRWKVRLVGEGGSTVGTKIQLNWQQETSFMSSVLEDQSPMGD